MFARAGRKDIIADDGRLGRVDVFAVDGDWFDNMRLAIGNGRFFSEDDNLRHRKLCVIGHKTAAALFDGDAVGHTLQAGPLRCRVVGQSSSREFLGHFGGLDRLDYIAVPLETLGDLDPKIRASAQIQLKTDSPKDNDIVKRVLNAVLNERHHGIDDFQIFDLSAIMNQFTSFFRIMQIIVGFLAGIALLVGGVGVMNMMLVSVSERVREIGIRKAVGASPRDISRQFLLEAMLLAGSGGAIGAGSGVGMSLLASLIIRHFKPRWVTVIASDSVIVALCVSVGVGLLFGYFPARRASKLDAIAAIRGT
jgi:putative ABC transport system permease protein